MADFLYSDRAKAHTQPHYWWRKELADDDVCKRVFDTVRFLDTYQNYKSTNNLRNVRLYGNLPIFGLAPSTFAVAHPRKGKRARINVVRSVVDTATSHIAHERPRPIAVTDGADYRLQKDAQRLNRFVLGTFEHNGVYDLGPQVFRDAALLRGGGLKITPDECRSQVNVERVFIEELLWDDADAVAGKPRQMFQRQYVAREVALNLWGGKSKMREAILNAPEPKPDSGWSGARNLADHIEVIEAWHLPSGIDAQDGMHAICLMNATLERSKYCKDHFPFALFSWTKPIRGLFGDSIGDQLTGIQVAINRHLDTIAAAFGLLAVPRILVEDGSEVALSHLTNEIGSVIKYATGSNPPVIYAPSVLPPELLNHLVFLIQQAYEIAGVTQLSATGQKPAGLDSGAALREYKDIESERFATVQRDYENLFVDAAKLVIDTAQDLFSDGKDVEVTLREGRFLEKIHWSEISLESTQYEMQILPTSMLPKTPAGRFAIIDEWIQRGYLSREEGMRLMQIPDLEDAAGLMTAAGEDIDAIVDSFLYGMPDDDLLEELPDNLDEDDRELAVANLLYQTPDPMSDLNLGVERMTQAYLRGKTQDVPEPRLDLFRRWVADAKALAADAMQQQQAQQSNVPIGAGPQQAAPPQPQLPPAA